MTETEAPRRTGRFVWRSTYSRYQMQRLAPERQRELHENDLAYRFGAEVVRRIADGRRYIVRIETRENHADDLVEIAKSLNEPLGLAPPLMPTPESLGFDVVQSTALVLLVDPYEAEVGEQIAHCEAFYVSGDRLRETISEVWLAPRHRPADGSFTPSTTVRLLKFQRDHDDVWTRVA